MFAHLGDSFASNHEHTTLRNWNDQYSRRAVREENRPFEPLRLWFLTSAGAVIGGCMKDFSSMSRSRGDSCWAETGCGEKYSEDVEDGSIPASRPGDRTYGLLTRLSDVSA